LGNEDVLKQNKEQAGKDEPYKDRKWGKGGISPPNLKSPLPLGSDVILTD
jgi:hypothetical protein